MPAKPVSKKQTPAAVLKANIDRFEPKIQKLFRSVQAAVRKRFAAANELAYEYRDSVVIAYSPTENGIEGIVSISGRADGVRLYFTNGPKLPDPKKMLQGSGTQTRFIQLEAASQLDTPDVKAL